MEIKVQQGKTIDNIFFICKNINLFGYSGGWGGGGGFNNQTGPILVHIYPLIYINLFVKYESNLISTLWIKIQNTVKLEYIKVQGTWVNTLIYKKFDITEFIYECLFHGDYKWVTIIVCRNTLTMVNIIYINLHHLYSILFLALTLFVSMILELATVQWGCLLAMYYPYMYQGLSSS